MRKVLSHLLMALSFSILFCGCATVFDGPTQKISIKTNVDGATIYDDDYPVGTTPLTFSVPRQGYYTLLIKKDGYQSKKLTMNARINGFLWVDAAMTTSGGSFGASTDFSNGSVWQYSPNKYYIELEPIKAADSKIGSPEADLKRLQVTGDAQLKKDAARKSGEYKDTETHLKQETEQEAQKNSEKSAEKSPETK